jgi:hypothetical protein
MKVGDLVRYSTPSSTLDPLGIVLKVWPHGNLEVKVFMPNGIWTTDQPRENFAKVEDYDESG